MNYPWVESTLHWWVPNRVKQPRGIQLSVWCWHIKCLWNCASSVCKLLLHPCIYIECGCLYAVSSRGDWDWDCNWIVLWCVSVVHIYMCTCLTTCVLCLGIDLGWCGHSHCVNASSKWMPLFWPLSIHTCISLVVLIYVCCSFGLLVHGPILVVLASQSCVPSHYSSIFTI